ncbi:alpha/beta hydrolase [Aureispira anguillae]|uniref:Lysophospholipase n=1 Tax=Aureispira anguillae TaxID=2864201 RepID=A0A915YI52_9BACT|nr:lysophospholipase [Aureispira anguillae]BDS13508.1 lysophospholipase [Aureispira anguillae]
MKIKPWKWIKWCFYLFILLFIGSNFIIYNHAYYFTHFVDKDLPKLTSEEIDKKTFWEKIKIGVYGVEIAKPRNKIQPDSSFKTISLGKSPRLDAWWIPTSLPPKGVVILFHGYSANKSSQLEQARVLRKLGYHTFLVDFRGHGDSEGFQTSIGYHEALDVQRAYQYIRTYHDLPISLLGTSMGAVSILKAMQDYQLDVEKLILECPFGSLKDAVYSRFENLNIPQVLLPELLLFWGGIQNNMNSWEHNAVNYARSIKVPTLIIYGEQDPKVRKHEIDAVFNALSNQRRLSIFKNAGHDHIMQDAPQAWTKAVWSFLEL